MAKSPVIMLLHKFECMDRTWLASTCKYLHLGLDEAVPNRRNLPPWDGRMLAVRLEHVHNIGIDDHG